MRNRQALIIAIGVLSIGAGIWLSIFLGPPDEPPRPPQISGIYLTPSKEVVDFKLTSQGRVALHPS